MLSTLENTKINKIKTLPLRNIRSNSTQIIEAGQNVSASIELHVEKKFITGQKKKIRADFSQEKGKKSYCEGTLILK